MTFRTQRKALWPALALVLVRLASPAAAQPAEGDGEARARRHYERGETLAAQGNLAEARREFEAGYAASRRPAFLFNIGECARELGDTAGARAAYEQYLAAEPDGKLAASARARLAELPAPPPPPQLLPVPRPATTATESTLAPDLTTPPGDALGPQRRPIWRRWQVWVGVGAAALVAGTVVVLARDDGGDTCAAACVDLR
jgi:tetratricopeptide (TPR) repeat protein